MNEKRLKEILKAMQVQCRSDAITGRFCETNRLTAINDLVNTSKHGNHYRLMFDGLTCKIYAKNGYINSLEPVILISSHVDTVPTKLFAIEDEEQRLLKGTFDNTITNAACVYAMTEMDLPDNVVFTFTADEETGHCRGAKSTVDYLLRQGIAKENIHAISLDVTYEGYKDCDFTIENAKATEDTAVFMDCINRLDKPYVYAKRYRDKAVDNAKHVSHKASWFDEGAAYNTYIGVNGLSFCMPVAGDGGENDMHSNNGVFAKTDAFVGYTQALCDTVKDYSLSCSLSVRLSRSGALQEHHIRCGTPCDVSHETPPEKEYRLRSEADGKQTLSQQHIYSADKDLEEEREM